MPVNSQLEQTNVKELCDRSLTGMGGRWKVSVSAKRSAFEPSWDSRIAPSGALQS